MLSNAFPVYRTYSNYRNQFNLNRILLKVLILINCLFSSSTSEHINPLEIGLCSDYLIENLISTSVSTFKQLWFTSDKISNLNRNKLTFVTYLDTWLRRDGAPNVNEVLQTLNCSEFGRGKGICKYELDSLKMKHTVFDGMHMYVFLQNQNNRLWRVIVIEIKTGKVILFDAFKNCEKRTRTKLKFYERFYCIINKHMNMDDVKNFLMMNIDVNIDVKVSPFEVWCFFKNNTMKKIRFTDREGNYQLIGLSLNSNSDRSIATVQFVTNNIVVLNDNLNSSSKPKRSIEANCESDEILLSNNLFNNSYEPFLNHSVDSFNHHKSFRLKRSDYREHYSFSNSKNHRHRFGKLKKRPKKRRKHRKKNRIKFKNLDSKSQTFNELTDKTNRQTTERSRKSIDFHLNRLITSLTTYLNSFNMTMESALNKLKEIKDLAIGSLFPFKQVEVIIFHKYYATFHAIESDFFIQPISQPYVQPNQIYLGCPQPFCFLTTIDDLTYNRITNELLIFRNQYYWSYKIDHQRNRNLPYIQINFPKLSDAKLISDDNQDVSINTQSDFPKAFPMYIDAATFIILDNFYYLVTIKDGWAFVYLPRQNKLVPLLLIDYFDERMSSERIDTMLFQNRQLFVFSGTNYWLYDILEGLSMKFNSKGVLFRNLPSYLDAAFTFNNRFYFFKQNFFYLNDAKGNSLINPQLVHDTFLVGCNKNKLPSDLDMSKLFKAPNLINYYCMYCPGYIIDRLKDKLSLNNNTFVTVQADDEIDERIHNGRFDSEGKFDRMDKDKIELDGKIQKTSISFKSKTTSNPIIPGIIRLNPSNRLTSKNPSISESPNELDVFDEMTDEDNKTDENKIGENKKDENKQSNQTNKLDLIDAINKLDEFALNYWKFLTHHLLVGFLLLLSFFFIIYLCKQGRAAFSPLDQLDDEDLIKRKGKARRREMRRRNRRWN